MRLLEALNAQAFSHLSESVARLTCQSADSTIAIGTKVLLSRSDDAETDDTRKFVSSIHAHAIRSQQPQVLVVQNDASNRLTTSLIAHLLGISLSRPEVTSICRAFDILSALAANAVSLTNLDVHLSPDGTVVGAQFHLDHYEPTIGMAAVLNLHNLLSSTARSEQTKRQDLMRSLVALGADVDMIRSIASVVDALFVVNDEDMKIVADALDLSITAVEEALLWETTIRDGVRLSKELNLNGQRSNKVSMAVFLTRYMTEYILGLCNAVLPADNPQHMIRFSASNRGVSLPIKSEAQFRCIRSILQMQSTLHQDIYSGGMIEDGIAMFAATPPEYPLFDALDGLLRNGVPYSDLGPSIQEMLTDTSECVVVSSNQISLHDIDFDFAEWSTYDWTAFYPLLPTLQTSFQPTVLACQQTWLAMKAGSGPVWGLDDIIENLSRFEATFSLPNEEFIERYSIDTLQEAERQGTVMLGMSRTWVSQALWQNLHGINSDEPDLSMVSYDLTSTRGSDSFKEHCIVEEQEKEEEDPGNLDDVAPLLPVKVAKRRKTPGHLITSLERKLWMLIVWATTGLIPAVMLHKIGGMRRREVQIAWREKVTICWLIALLCGIVLFQIIGLGKVLCPGKDSLWSASEVAGHNGDYNYFTSIHGKVYDLTNFWRLQHSDSNTQTSPANMRVFAGQDLSDLFPNPLYLACPNLVTDQTTWMSPNISVNMMPGVHYTGTYKTSDSKSKLYNDTWYSQVFQPSIKQFLKGDVAILRGEVAYQGQSKGKNMVIINKKVYDLTVYFRTKSLRGNSTQYSFFDQDVESIFTNNAGSDVTKAIALSPRLTPRIRQSTMECLNNAFYVGVVDYRQSGQCRVNNYVLIGFTGLLCSVILVKFLAALNFSGKRAPSIQEKFVICQIPCYTESEEQLRKAIDSLTALDYDDNHKLLVIICDGMVIGDGNEMSTPEIVLSVLRSSPALDPEPKIFHSIGSKPLNRAKVYSGLYLHEGHVVPYLCVVKVGHEGETGKLGNRGKRDSQILLLNFLNRVHHKTEMNPLELEMYRQLRHVIGVQPESYEHLLMVDADTEVREDSLTRLVASCTQDPKIMGICGETSLENEHKSWWTMIQVYEYHISHHLSKAFESMFGSVTCLPGCFTMYAIRSQEGKPLIIASKLLADYSKNAVTLHEKNLLTLGMILRKLD